MHRFGSPEDDDEYDDLKDLLHDERHSDAAAVEKAVILSQVYHYQNEDRFCYVVGNDTAQQIQPIDEEHYVQEIIAGQWSQDELASVTDIWPDDVPVLRKEEHVPAPPNEPELFLGSRHIQEIRSLHDILRMTADHEELTEYIPDIVSKVLDYHTRTAAGVAQCRLLLHELLVQPDSIFVDVAEHHLESIFSRYSTQYLLLFPEETLAALEAQRHIRVHERYFFQSVGVHARDIQTVLQLDTLAKEEDVCVQNIIYTSYLDTLTQTTPETIISHVVLPLCSDKKRHGIRLYALQTMRRLGYTYDTRRHHWTRASGPSEE